MWIAACAVACLPWLPARAETLRADVVILDSTPGGIAAAIAAARKGLTTVIVSEWPHVGGMQTSGLGNTNAGRRETVGGLAREFHERILRHYRERHGEDSAQVRDCDGGFFFEPHAALAVSRKWLAEAGVRCLDGEAMLSVRKDGARLVSVRTDRGREIEGGAVRRCEKRRLDARLFTEPWPRTRPR